MNNFMIILITIMICLLSVECPSVSDSRRYNVDSQQAPLIPGEWMETDRGIKVFVPSWLSRHKSVVDLVFKEIDTVIPDKANGVQLDQVGVPSYIKVYIQDPGEYSSSYSPNGLGVGHTDMRTFIYVAFKYNPKTGDTLLPALAHELTHVVLKDPSHDWME